MAIQKANGTSGILGSLVFYVRNGVQCSRVRTASFTDAKTANQLAHREKMRKTARFVKNSIKVIRIGYQQASSDSASNEIRSFIMKNCFVKVPGEPLPVLDFSKIMVSRGLISPPRNTTFSTEGKMATITWENVKLNDELSKSFDKLVVVLYGESGILGYSNSFDDLAVRKEMTATFEIPKHTFPWHVWIFFSNSDNAVGESRRKISDSVYLGCIE